jgi:hypothetical protein
VTENESFKTWLDDTKPGIFWLSGILGSGKSVVCAATLDHLLCMPRGDNDHIAFFFCQFDDADSLLTRTIIGTLIRQCLSADTLPQNVEAKMLDLFKSGSPDVEELEELFLDVVGTSKTVKILIDGLDECSRPARMVVLKLLSRLVSSQSITKVIPLQPGQYDRRYRYSFRDLCTIEHGLQRSPCGHFIVCGWSY